MILSRRFSSFRSCRVVVAATLLAVAASAQLPIFNPATGSTYVQLPPSSAAAARVAAFAMGGSLVKFNNQAEMNWVVAAFMPFGGASFIGLSDAANEGTFVWDDGTSPAFSAWAAGQPDDGGSGEDDVELVVTMSGLPPLPVAAWTDLPSNALRQAIVEIPPVGDTAAVGVVVNADGVYPYDGTLMATAGPSAPCAGLAAADPHDVWFRYVASTTGTLVVSNCAASSRAPGGSASVSSDTYLAAWSGSPTNLTLLACEDGAPECNVFESEVSIPVTAGQSYYLQVGAWGAPATAVGALSFKLAAPGDDCAGAYAIFGGVNGPFTNAGAASGAAPSCAPSGADVWFRFDVPSAGKTTITVAPATAVGFAPLSAPVLQIYDGCGGPQLSCASGPANAAVTSVVGSFGAKTLLVRVSGGLAGPSTVGFFTIQATFAAYEFVLSSPSGPGTIKVENRNGVPGAFYFSLFTLNQGAFPNGPFGGLSASPLELLNQLALYAPPCFGVLNAAGGSTFGPVGGAPPVTVYAVTFLLDASGYVAHVSTPVAHTIP